MKSIRNIDGVIYHDRCPDGKAGAWVFWRENRDRFENGKMFMIGLSHGQNPPENIEDKIIVIVDFCFPRMILEQMASKARKIIVLDHHKSSQKSLEDLNLPNVESVFDMKRSGAQIAWDYVYENSPRPWFVDVIADRDLWKWEHTGSKETGKAMSVKGWYTWDSMEKMYWMSESDKKDFILEMTKIGRIYIEIEEREISIICSKAILADFTIPDGRKFRVRIVCCPSNYRSEVGNKLCEKNSDIDFAVLWQYDFLLDEWWISCRGTSYDDAIGDSEKGKHTGIDLSEICSQFERGGGHPNAAGFTIFGGDRIIPGKDQKEIDSSCIFRKGEKLQNYFKPIEVPKNRPQDMDLF